MSLLTIVNCEYFNQFTNALYLSFSLKKYLSWKYRFQLKYLVENIRYIKPLNKGVRIALIKQISAMSSGAIHFDPIRCENIYKRKDGTLIREYRLKWLYDDDTRPALFLPMPMLKNSYRFWMSLADKWENRKIVSHRNGQSKRGIDHFYVQLSRWIDLMTISFLAFGCDFPWIIINYSAACEFIRNNRYATKFRTAFKLFSNCKRVFSLDFFLLFFKWDNIRSFWHKR